MPNSGLLLREVYNNEVSNLLCYYDTIQSKYIISIGKKTIDRKE